MLSLNEIRDRAVAFAKEWRNERNERAEAQTFWNQFFEVFGVPRRRVAAFDKFVKSVQGQQGFIDLLWKGIVLVEHKSKDGNLDSAYEQAKGYFPGLKDEELPRYIIVSDFSRFRLYDLEEGGQTELALDELHLKIDLFAFISGYNVKKYQANELPVNLEAADLMGDLHDALTANGYHGHELEVLLVRILFCLFAEDTAIFERRQFTDYVERKTREDGTDLGIHLAQLFQTLNTDENARQASLDEDVAAFPYVNGALFSEHINLASFNGAMRNILVKCCYFDWSKISPAIFGSMFQHVIDSVEPSHRRQLGAHYTSEENILKLLNGLFLEELWQEFRTIGVNKTKLGRFHDKIARLKFLDPACGCGNFLIITYRELRMLELEVLKLLFAGQLVTDVRDLSRIDVDSFYGIEYSEFPAQVATVAMWLIDHQMNLLLSIEYGLYYRRLPLRRSPHIIHGNALRTDWNSVISPTELSYIIGNPPFVGKNKMTTAQGVDMNLVCNEVRNSGVLDYVCGWYFKAARYIQGTKIPVGFVSTNSICQGEQVSVLWAELVRLGVIIHFAHRTFKWKNEAKGNAGVHVVIIGFALTEHSDKRIFDYANFQGAPVQQKVTRINCYLVPGDHIFLNKRRRPIDTTAPLMAFGSMPNDGGNLILSESESAAFIRREPAAAAFIRPLIGSEEYINGTRRYCLWLKDVNPSAFRGIPEIQLRLEAVRQKRLNSKRATTQRLAAYPSLFAEIRQPAARYLAFPEVSSERRKYIPTGFVEPEIICSNKIYSIDGASLFHFGVLTSLMHMTWVNNVCGRLESRYQYSTGVVYNNFPWPLNVGADQHEKVERLAEAVLSTRLQYSTSKLADLYDPLAMPADLVKAHDALDRAVDMCYRAAKFNTSIERMVYLFDLHRQRLAPLLAAGRTTRRRR